MGVRFLIIVAGELPFISGILCLPVLSAKYKKSCCRPFSRFGNSLSSGLYLSVLADQIAEGFAVYWQLEFAILYGNDALSKGFAFAVKT